MKNAQRLPLLIGSILLASSVLAQTMNSSHPDNRPETDSVAVARSPYLEAENVASPANNRTSSSRVADENKTLAQYSQRRFGPPYGPAMRPPTGGSGTGWGPDYGHHSAIGALIGFGVGAGVGAIIGASKDNGANQGADALVGGLLLGGLGAAVGAAITSFPSLPSRQFRRHRPWEDEDHDGLGSRSRPHSTNHEASSQTASSEVPAKRQTALAEIASVP